MNATIVRAGERKTAGRRHFRELPHPRLRVVAALGLSLLLASCGDTRPPGESKRLAAHWSGEAAIGGLDTVRVEMDLGRVGARWVGQYDVPAYDVEDYPIDVSVDSAVTLRFSGVEADFVGTVKRDSLVGSLTYEGRPFPTGFARRGSAQFPPEFLALESASAEGTRPRLLSADARELREQFNEDRDRTRLLLLLSPS